MIVADALPDCPQCGAAIRQAKRVGLSAHVQPCGHIIPAEVLRPTHVDACLERELVTDGGHCTGDTEQPGCPICSRPMEFCDPSHEKAYWACPADHEPPGIVQLADEVGYACALAIVRVNDHFDEHGVEPFAEVDVPGDVPGLVVDLVLERIQHCVEFKRMRQREGHDELESTTGPDPDEAQTDLGRWSA